MHPMTELIWDGKYDKATGKKVAPLPFFSMCHAQRVCRRFAKMGGCLRDTIKQLGKK